MRNEIVERLVQIVDAELDFARDMKLEWMSRRINAGNIDDFVECNSNVEKFRENEKFYVMLKKVMFGGN